MRNYQKIKVDGIEYYIINSIQNLRAEDSFIFHKNKLEEFSGKGEARKYVGSYSGTNGQKLSEFFNYESWGNVKVNGKRTYPIIQNNNCFFSKNNLLKYLDDAKMEYIKQEQIYKDNISNLFKVNLERVNSLEKNNNFFSIYDVSDFIDNKQSRGYIRSDDKIWDIWRKLVLPKISYLSILKIVKIEDIEHESPLFYFRILLDYQFRSIVHPKSLINVENEIEEEIPKEAIAKYRKGATNYRRKVIEHMPQCPFTKISDERLLIASHIKPYNICIKEDKENEALDYLNGLSLSPTYDKLFDQGYITFTNKGELVCGTQLSPYTWEKLNINPNSKNIMRIFLEDREYYLEYHRNHVFQDDINNII
ncbi:restriction endonuclease [Malaciobacter molluscorum]|uniref:HNH endonuclease n=1 Tax=Malaciobacter molluscorum TaxID=1032072 RepID=UPI00100BAC5F|nr:HNH endonuclease [Malaciobacter molluscorum]RXJ94373.1 restriction endonuclease [Malaciobacter molluscorum]